MVIHLEIVSFICLVIICFCGLFFAFLPPEGISR